MTIPTGGDPADRLLLAIETAGSACSVAIARGDVILAATRRGMRHGHAEALMPMVAATAEEAGAAPMALDTIAVAVGPGGFTGIRAGIAAAQGIALASGAALIGVTCFAAVAARAAPGRPAEPLLVALDSRRADLYVQLLGPGGSSLSPASAVLPHHLAAFVQPLLVAGGRLLVAGNAADGAAAALADRIDVATLPDSAPDAVGVVAALGAYWRGGGVGAAAPLYLRPPDVTLPKTSAPATLPR